MQIGAEIQPFQKREWKPFPAQVKFLELPDEVFEALYGGAAGGGKSDALVLLPIVRGFYKLPMWKGIIFRRTFPELESEIILRSLEWYPATGGTYSADKKRWTWPSGAILQFAHCEYEQDIRKYDTAEYNYAAFDELTSFTKFQYQYFTRTRMRTSRPGYPTIVRSGTNPGNVGHGWVRDWFIENKNAYKLYRDAQDDTISVFIPSFATDNPHIDAGYIRRMQGLPEAERRAKLDGDWYTFEGQVFGDYREEHFPGEPEHAIHVIDPFEIPEFWPKILAVDWGYEAMTYAVWGAMSPGGRLYLYREYSARRTKIADWTADIANIVKDERVDATVMCRSSWQNRGEELLIAEQFARATGLRPEFAENDRIAGKLGIQEYLRWRQKPVRQNNEDYDHDTFIKLLRMKGSDVAEQYKRSFMPVEPEKNLPKLQIFRSLPIIRKVIPLCVYAKKHQSTGKPSEDVQEFAGSDTAPGDDPYDALRYLVLRADRFKGSVDGIHQDLERRGAVVQQLADTKDMTAFYRQMEHLERTSARPRTSVRKFRRLLK